MVGLVILWVSIRNTLRDVRERRVAQQYRSSIIIVAVAIGVIVVIVSQHYQQYRMGLTALSPPDRQS
jgi:uncharacterized membrane protein